MRRWIFALFFCGVFSAAAQLRIVDYNTAGAARESLSTLLAAFGDEKINGVSKAPDVLTLQEQDSSATTTKAIVDMLNAIYGAGVYARSTLDGITNGAGRQEIIYNTTTVQLIAETTASTVDGTAGAVSQTMRYQLRPVGYTAAADFYVYVSHYKASSGSSNAARRNVEAVQVRANADALGQGTSIIYAGDFNIYSSSEPMWTTLTASGAGQAFDPIDRAGSWSNNSSFKDVHTQSPVTSARYGGQITGGMDDRFDFQLISGELLDAEGISYLAGSYHAFGNTGTHAFNGEITSGSASALQASLPGYSLSQATAVLNALADSSDHLPVVAQYQLPAKMSVETGLVPARMIVGASASIGVSVSNVAPVMISVGADELDYVVAGTGAVTGAGSGSVLALQGDDVVMLGLDTASVGAKLGGVSVVSSSQSAANSQYSSSVAYEVLDHAHPQFAAAPSQLSLTLDFGTVEQFSVPLELPFSIENALSSLGATAGLDLDAVFFSGPGVFTTTLHEFSDLGAGDTFHFSAWLATNLTGDFLGSYTLSFSDEDLLGTASLGTLSLTLTGRVVAVPEPRWLVGVGLVFVGACLASRRASRRL